MAFRISGICDNWFSNLAGQDPLKRIFDYYYLCSLLGLAAGRKGDPNAEGKEFVEDFITAYRPFQRRIIGLLIVAHLHELGIGVDEKEAVAEQLAKLVTPSRTSQLTDEGFRLLNAFCQGGFEELSESVDKPHKMVFFLQKYRELLDAKILNNPVWSAATVTPKAAT